MSSMLQFRGRVDSKGVHLRFYQIKSEGALDPEAGARGTVRYLPGQKPDRTPTETFTCPICGREHPLLYEAVRKPAGTWGHWVVFRYNGEEHVPDLSIPISVERLPRGAKPLGVEGSANAWHSK
jgi:hypothetical protein